MGILDTLINENLAHVSDSGGFVSPGGVSFVGRSHKILGAVPAAIACKRIILDEHIAMAAKKAGADLREEISVEVCNLVSFPFSFLCLLLPLSPTLTLFLLFIAWCLTQDAKFSEEEGLWTVFTKSGQTFKARVLVCADGAPSRLATHLGLVNEAPGGICSRAYVDGGTHNFEADGVVFYNKGLLPGYAALFRHPDNVLNYCCYIIPGNPDVTVDDLKYWHEYLMTKVFGFFTLFPFFFFFSSFLSFPFPFLITNNNPVLAGSQR